jgi:hypothetical protein
MTYKQALLEIKSSGYLKQYNELSHYAQAIIHYFIDVHNCTARSVFDSAVWMHCSAELGTIAEAMPRVAVNSGKARVAEYRLLDQRYVIMY